MSASTEKKNRQAARQAGTDKKALAAQAEAKRKAKSKRNWTLGTIGIVLFIALVIFLNSSFLYTHTSALTVGDQSYTPARVSYHYANQYYTWANQYGSYASIFGLDTSAGISGLDAQSCPMLEEGTWKDYFMDSAKQEIVQMKALLDYAAANSIELSDEERAQVESGFDGLEESVKEQGYGSVNKFFAANYGKGVDQELVLQAQLEAALANKVLEQTSDSFQYSEDELEQHYESISSEQDKFSLAYYYVAADKVSTEAEDGSSSESVTEETLAQAKAEAEAILAAYEDGILPAAEDETDTDTDTDAVTDAGADTDADAETGAGADTDADTDVKTDTDADEEGTVFEDPEAEAAADRFDAALASQVEDGSSTRLDGTAGSGLGVYKDWLLESRELGDAGIVENSNGEGYYVVLFLGRDDNHYKLAQVRHILIKAEADENGSYTDEAKAAALEKAEELYAQWQAGDMSEESFAALAEEHSEDAGSNTNGGLYDTVAKGQMVEEFDRFCFEGHEPGDTAIVYGESSGYAGYHIMYYVGEGQLYSDYIAENSLRSSDLQSWLDAQCESYQAAEGFGFRFV